uniref:Neuronal-specific septin-3 n=2 Tax=Cyprinus carpio TaxID=7962 RepID=A0A8C1Q7E1_CYPCA
MNPRDLDQTGNMLPIGSPLDSPFLSSARLSPCLIPLSPSPSRLSPCPINSGSSPSRLSPLSTSPSCLSPSSHFISSYSPVCRSPCPTCDLSTSPIRVSPCPVHLSPSVVLKKPMNISSLSQTGQSLEQQNHIDSSPQSIINTVDTSLNSPHLKSVNTISQLETSIGVLPADENKPLHSADMHGKTWPVESKMSRLTPVSSTEKSVRSMPITNTRGQKKQTGQQQDPFRPPQQDKLKQNSNIYCRGATKPSTFESLSPKNLRHVEKSAYRPQHLASYQKKLQSQDPTLVRIRLGLIKTGRIINSGAQFSNLERIKGSNEEENIPNIQSNGHPAVSEKLKQPIRSKILLGATKRIIRPMICERSCWKPQNQPQVSVEGTRQFSRPSALTNPISLPKATTKQKVIFQELNNVRSLKEYSKVVSSNSELQDRASENCNATNERNMMMNSSQHDNQESKSKIRPQSAASETESTIITYSNASDQCSRMSCFQFPLKSHRSSTECGQLSRICRPVIKRTSDSRSAYFKTPQAWRSSSSNQTTGNTRRDVSNSSRNRCSLSDSDSSKSSSSEANLSEDYRFARRHRGSQLYKMCATSCPTKFVGDKCKSAVHPDLSDSPNTHTDSEMLKYPLAGWMPRCLFTLDQQQESKHTLHSTDCDRFQDMNSLRLTEREDPLPLQPSVVTDTRSGVDSCSEECLSADMSEIVPPEVRPKPVVPAKPSHVAPHSSGPFVPSPQGTGGEGRGSALLGYIGIDTIIEQMRKKTMKTGFDFNIMVVGQSGLGKSTLVNTLFKSQVSRRTTSWSRDEKIPKTVEIKSVSHVIEEGGVKMKLTVIDTPGFGDQINNENCWEPISKYINEQYEKFLKEEVNIARKKRIPDTRVHCCLYFISPTGHSLRQLDIEFMKHLSRVVNIIPVIAKSDTLTLDEKTEFKQRVRKELEACGIECYPQKEFDEDMEDKSDNDKIREAMPFAVVGSDKEYQVNGKRVLGRKTAWGVVEVENPNHCEFSLLRDFMIRSHLQDLKEVTHNIHYETYRAKRLNDNGGLHPITSSGQDTQESNL